MITRTITFVVITTLHLASVTFTMDSYMTDAPIWSQTETTTDRTDHFSSTAYQQMAATNSAARFNYVTSTIHNELNVSLENLVSAFSTSIYIGNCSDLQEHTVADEFQYISYDGEFTGELVRTAWQLYDEFNTLIKTAMWFLCTVNTTVGHEVINMSRIYVHNCTKFMVRLNGTTAATSEVAVLGTVADLYRTSIQHVESVKELVEHVTEIVSEEANIDAMNRSILQQMEAVKSHDYSYNKSSVLEIIVGKQNELVNLLKNFIERYGNMSEHTERNPLINVITSSKLSRYLNAQYWAQLLEQETQVLINYQKKLRGVKDIQFVRYKVTPVIIAIVMVVGITGNGLLLMIFVRHKETRTLANSMLINLTVVDLLSLVVNVLLQYLRSAIPWKFDSLGCKLFLVLRYLLFALSTYSVAMISVQRFVAVKQLPLLAWCHQSKKTKYVLIATVWCLGFILSVPQAVVFGSKNGKCSEVSFKVWGHGYTAVFFVVCLLPLLITAVFSGVTANRIRRSVREIPGEAIGQGQLKHNRMVSSTVLFALTIIFVVSYAPNFLVKYLIVVAGISEPDWKLTLVKVITYYLRFANCCLNPIVLFVMSKRYRVYIHRYCGQKKVQPASNSQGSIETSLSA